ncbi:MAG: SulP family inorganic anion transporter, partial [Planctomycetes bacterium]|nr:SulP family inorganic anion transporter [Planctomycetota bacterium]
MSDVPSATVPETEELDEGLPAETETASSRGFFFRLIPAFDSLRQYSPTAFRSDLIAGLTVAAVAVPQAMAYATIFGVPVEYGLYTAMVMTAVGALFDSSRQLINGPTNAISIALLSALATIP